MNGTPWAVITEEELDTFQELRAKKLKYAEIAQKMGCTVKRIDRMQLKAMERTPPIIQKLIRKPWRIDDASIESDTCTD